MVANFQAQRTDKTTHKEQKTNEKNGTLDFRGAL